MCNFTMNLPPNVCAHAGVHVHMCVGVFQVSLLIAVKPAAHRRRRRLKSLAELDWTRLPCQEETCAVGLRKAHVP